MQSTKIQKPIICKKEDGLGIEEISINAIAEGITVLDDQGFLNSLTQYIINNSPSKEDAYKVLSIVRMFVESNGSPNHL